MKTKVLMLLSATIVTYLFAACAPATPQMAEVIREVPVQKVVRETVEVEGVAENREEKPVEEARPESGPVPREGVTTLPIDARVEGGEVAWEVLAQPEACDPRSPEYVPLRDLEEGDITRPPYEEGYTRVKIYINDKGQRFQLMISSGSSDLVDEYIDQGSVCLEAIRSDRPPPKGLEGIWLDAILIRATGLSYDDLRTKYLTSVAAGSGSTLADTVGWSEVPDSAVEQAVEAVLSAYEEGRLAPEDISGVFSDQSLSLDQAREALDQAAHGDTGPLEDLLRVLLEALVNQPDPPFLTLLRMPQSDAEYADMLQADPESNLVVDLEWLQAEYSDPESGEYWTVHYAVDPPIDRYRYHYYRAKCQTSARVGLLASAGSMYARLWHWSPYHYDGYVYASAACCSWSGWQYDSSFPNEKAYDTGVSGLQDESHYAIYGGWSQGYGGDYCH